MKVAKEKGDDQDQNFDQLKGQVNNLTCELLKERITRIDFQVQLLTQWRQQCQQELEQLLTNAENNPNPKN
jgi:DNA-nicking Smr family endonuclease